MMQLSRNVVSHAETFPGDVSTDLSSGFILLMSLVQSEPGFMLKSSSNLVFYSYFLFLIGCVTSSVCN